MGGPFCEGLGIDYDRIIPVGHNPEAGFFPFGVKSDTEGKKTRTGVMRAEENGDAESGEGNESTWDFPGKGRAMVARQEEDATTVPDKADLESGREDAR